MAARPASGLPNPLLYLVSVCEPDSVFSVFFPEGREWSCRLYPGGRELLFVAVGHFAHFGARFPVFGAVRPCASARDRPTISDFSGSWLVPLFYHFEEHWGPRCPLRGRMPLPVPTAGFRDPELRDLGPEHSFRIGFLRFSACTSVSS